MTTLSPAPQQRNPRNLPSEWPSQSMDHAVATSEPLHRWRLAALVVGGAAMLVAIIAGFFQPGIFFRAYLFAWVPIWGLCLGALALVMIHHLTGGVWGLLVRRVLEAQMSTLPL